VAQSRFRWHERRVLSEPLEPRGPKTVADCVAAPAHAGALDGARRLGEARGAGNRVVRLGVFADGRVRFRATTCASLIAYAEVACEALEAGVPPSALDPAGLRARVAGVHPSHLERAALVAAAILAAYPPEGP
jgi:hypothetical protein